MKSSMNINLACLKEEYPAWKILKIEFKVMMKGGRIFRDIHVFLEKDRNRTAARSLQEMMAKKASMKKPTVKNITPRTMAKTKPEMRTALSGYMGPQFSENGLRWLFGTVDGAREGCFAEILSMEGRYSGSP